MGCFLFLLKEFFLIMSILLTLATVASTALSLSEFVTMLGSSRILALLHASATARPTLW